MPRIFISYRRADSKWATARLYDYLSQRYGSDNIFIDIDTIGPGEDFVQVIGDAIGACDAVLVVIGPQWLNASDERGQRLTDPHDYVRREVASALEKDKLVIPVLIDGAPMPSPDELPEGLASLASRNALDISRKRFQHDVDQLVNALDRVDAPVEPPSETRQAEQPRIPTWLLFAGAVIVISAFLGVTLSRIGNGTDPPASTDSPPTAEERPTTPAPTEAAPTEVAPTEVAPTEAAVEEVVEYSPLPDCPPSRLRVGDAAYVSLDTGQNGVRSSPDNSLDNVLGMADPGETMLVIGGPECSFGWLMWEVETETGLAGWTPEGDGEEFWLMPGTPE